MKKVLIIHGFRGSPNGNWKPWLLAELEKLDVYASSIALPNPNNPTPEAWVSEIAHQLSMDTEHEIFLVGHSLGVSAILRYLESPQAKTISGVILVSGPCKPTENRITDSFVAEPFNYELIKSLVENVLIIHSDNDPYVPLEHANILSQKLNGKLIVVSGAGHFNSANNSFTLPQCLEGLKEMFNK